MVNKRSNVQNIWGSLFGLSPKDLTTEQLGSLRFEKLIECIKEDSRIPYMIAARISSEKPLAIAYISKLSKEDISKYPTIIHSYNRYLDINLPKIEEEIYGRYDIIIWHMLEERHKKYEIDAWLNNRASVVRDDNVDYAWLYEKYPDKAKQKIDSFINKIKHEEYHRYGWGWSGVKHMIQSDPAKYINATCEVLFDKNNRKKNIELQLLTLANKNLLPEHTILSLKIAARRLYWPTIRAKITKGILEGLATVTRLNVIEKLIQLKYPIHGLKNEADFKALMFGALMRHPERVEKAVRFFDVIKPQEIIQ